MDHMPPRERYFDVDLESGVATREEVGIADPALGAKEAKTFFTKVCSGFVSIDGSISGERGVSLSCCVPNKNGVSLDHVKLLVDNNVEGDVATALVENKSGKERRKTKSAKKPPRPPRPSKALSLDAADQKLIKEISELAMMKRARTERIKALKKMKAAKASTSTSTGSFIAMLFTIIFCLVIIFQGISPGRSSTVSFQGSPGLAQVADSGFISVPYHRNTSASDTSIPVSGSPSLLEQVFGSDPGDNVRRAAG